MCDYSLESQVSRKAKAGDKLVTSGFPMTPTRGFCAEGEPGVAVCLMPGTELVFDRPIRFAGFWGLIINMVRGTSRVARFRQVDTHRTHIHHDALELPDGRIMRLTFLQEGQRARVLQLPPTEIADRQKRAVPAEAQEPELVPLP